MAEHTLEGRTNGVRVAFGSTCIAIPGVSMVVEFHEQGI